MTGREPVILKRRQEAGELLPLIHDSEFCSGADLRPSCPVGEPAPSRSRPILAARVGAHFDGNKGWVRRVVGQLAAWREEPLHSFMRQQDTTQEVSLLD